MSHNLLSDDLWRFIGSKLDAPDRIRFGAASKSWMSLLPPTPWLMLAQSEEGQESASEDEAEHPQGGGQEYMEEDEDEQEDENENENVGSEDDDDGHESEENQDDQDSGSIEADDGQSPVPAAAQPQPQPPPPRRGFFCVVDQQIYQIDFPDLHKAQCVGSTGSWAITAHKDKTIRLLNPFSKQQHYLPSQSSFKHNIFQSSHPSHYKLRHLHLWKVVLSSPPSNGKHCIALALHHAHRILGIARLGDDTWSTVGDPEKPGNSAITDIIFYRRKFYALSIGRLVVIDIGDDSRSPPAATLLSHVLFIRPPGVYSHHYLAEWCGELLMVIKFVSKVDRGSQYTTLRFEIYKFDFTNNKWDELKSLGQYSLFVGFNTSVSLRASDYFGKLKENCIYFTDDFTLGYRGTGIPAGVDMGVFSLVDQSITPHFQGVSTCLYSPPVWIVPT